MVSPVHAGVVVIPNAQTSTVGNESSGNLAGGPLDIIVQEVFGRSQFPSGDLLLTQIAWRLKPETGPVEWTATSFDVHMSTTPFAPNTFGGNTLITPTFADNIGPDNTLVFSGTGTLFSSPGCTGTDPCPFDIVFPLSTPFLYNRAEGFLLVDFRANGLVGVGSGEFDVQRFFGPGFPPEGGVLAGVVGLSGATTGEVQLSGNVVAFSFTAVPEPGSLGLMLCGAAVLAGARRIR
jgi:hypothetical protein